MRQKAIDHRRITNYYTTQIIKNTPYNVAMHEYMKYYLYPRFTLSSIIAEEIYTLVNVKDFNKYINNSKCKVDDGFLFVDKVVRYSIIAESK